MKHLFVCIFLSGCASAFHWQSEMKPAPENSSQPKLNCVFMNGIHETSLAFNLSLAQYSRFKGLQTKITSKTEEDTDKNLAREYLGKICNDKFGQDPALAWIEVNK